MAIKSCKQLLEEFDRKKEKVIFSDGELLNFDIKKTQKAIGFYDISSTSINSDITIYNPTKPIIRNDKKLLFGRVEPLCSEESKIVLFEERRGKWKVVKKAPILGLQDPFYVENVQGYHIIGGVCTYGDLEKSETVTYETVFYRYKKSILELLDENGQIKEPFAKGPMGMKDIRLIQLQNGKIGVFTRPQGGKAGLGKIGYIEINDLDDLSENILKGRIITGQFKNSEWGGANDLHLLKNGKIGVLGHIAHFDGEVRHYYAMSFAFDPESRKASRLKILTTANEFPPVIPKKACLGKIIFSGGMHRDKDNTALLYVGVGDVRAGRIKINDPFLEYE